MKRFKTYFWIALTVAQVGCMAAFVLAPKSVFLQAVVVVLTVTNVLFSTLDLRLHLWTLVGHGKLTLKDTPMIEAIVALVLTVTLSLLPASVVLWEILQFALGANVLLFLLLLAMAKVMELW